MDANPNPASESATEEIKELESRLEQKKKELSKKTAELPPEKEVLRQVLREKIQAEKATLEKPATGQTPTPAPAITHIPAATPGQKEKIAEKIKEVVETALTKGIGEAVRLAQKNSPYLVDELHDHLVDEYYDKLIALKKIKKT